MSVYSIEGLADRVVIKRRRLRLTQEELGDQIGLKGQHVSAIENGYREPSIRTLVRLAEGLETSTDWLLGKNAKEAATR